MTDRNDGSSGWRPPDPRGTGRPPPYGRSIAWAFLAWAATVALVYVVAQLLGVPQLGGWLGLAGFLLGYWVGGTRGGINGRREWIGFVVILSALALVAFGFGSCMYAMALYG
jgi:hypothetical protein